MPINKKAFVIYHTILFFSFLVWFANGLLFKIFNLLPRHRSIVSILLSEKYSLELTNLIGLGEIIMAVWILSKWRSADCIKGQIVLVMAMNIIEFIFVPEMLMFGRFNLLWAALFSLLIYLNQFKIKEHVSLS